MYNHHSYYNDDHSLQNPSRTVQNLDYCIFFDGISAFSQKGNDHVQSFNQMIKELEENENKEVYIHVFCKNTNKSSATCADRIWISISYINSRIQDGEEINQQNIFVLYSGYPYSHNFFSIHEEGVDCLRSILESSSHPKIFATKDIANDSIKIFFNYFKIKIRSATFLVDTYNRWFSGLEAFRNGGALRDVIETSLQKFQRNSSERFNQIYDYSTKFQSEEPSETSDHSDIVILLSTFHSVLNSVKEKKILIA